MMTANEQKFVRWFEAVNKGREEMGAAVDDLMRDDIVQHGAMTVVGKEVMREMMSSFYDAFPDFHADIEDLFSAGDRVVYRISVSGTHRGMFMGLPPTGKTFRSPVISVSRWVDGKVAEEWLQWDVLGAMHQLGAGSPVGA
jgi:steroid delta-isomerase-like uncharacterized protein